MGGMPNWADVVLVPVVSLLLAAIISAIVFIAVGQNPWEALKLMAYGAVGTSDFLGYTLFYATNFIFWLGRGGGVSCVTFQYWW